jgi:hypothetical protein
MRLTFIGVTVTIVGKNPAVCYDKLAAILSHADDVIDWSSDAYIDEANPDDEHDTSDIPRS